MTPFSDGCRKTSKMWRLNFGSLSRRAFLMGERHLPWERYLP